MTNEEYVKAGGCRCPFCGGTSLYGGFTEVDEGGAWQPVFCEDCGKEWNDIYKLLGYEEVTQ